MNVRSIDPRNTTAAGARVALLAVFLIGCMASGASAQSDQTLECGARIVSNMRTEDGARLCLFAEDTGNGARVAIRRCGSQPGFLWRIIRRDGGGLHILAASRADEERRMEVADFNKNNGGRIQMWSANIYGAGYRSQTWDFFPVAGGGSLIISVDSGKCLNIPLGTGSPLDQLFLQQFTCTRVANDTWTVEPVLTGAGRDCR